MRLREKFVIPVVFIIVLGLGVSAIISYTISKRSIKSLINNELLIVSDSLERQLEFWLKLNKSKIVELSHEEYTRLSLRDTFTGKKAREIAYQVLSNQKKQNKSIDSLQIINREGVTMASSDNISPPPISHQIPISPAHDFNQVLNGTVIITDIFKPPSLDTPAPVFHIMAPIYDEDRIVGVFKGRIKFNFFCRDVLAKVKVGETGHAIICNRDGVVICHPDKNLLFKSTLEDLAISPYIEDKKKQFVNFYYKGQRQHASMRTVQLTNWILILSVDLNEINHPLHQVMAINVIIIGFSLFVAFLIALGFSHLVSQPLRKIIDFSRAIGQGDFSHRLNTRSNDEIGLLSLAMEKMAKQLHENMTTLAESNKELLQQRKAADAANLAKTNFLANMSHEIRTPMNAIIGFTSLMQTTNMTSQQKNYLTQIDASAKSLLLIINEILDFSEIEANQLTLENVNFYLRYLMNQLSSMFVIPAAEQGIELTLNISREVPQKLCGDPLRLRQILINLISNAIKFTHKETGKAEVIVAVRLQKRDQTHDTLEFSVSDSGIGIAEDEKEKLFDAFTQVDTSTTRQFGGIGLGLSICRRLVGMMGGEISVESEVGVGSRFIFIVPFIRHDAEISKNKKTFELDCESWFQKPALWGQGSDRPDVDQLNLAGINIKNAMTRLGGNGALYRKLLYDFAESSPQVMKQIASALQDGKDQIAMKMVHTLKGTAGNLSADGVYNAAAALELTLSQKKGCDDAQVAEKRVEKITLQLNILQHHLDPIVKTVMQWDDPSGETEQINEPSKPTLSPHASSLKNLDMPQVRTILEELISLLSKNDTQALIAFNQFNEILKKSTCQARLNKIKILMDQFDFEAALPLLNEIAMDLNQQKKKWA